MTLHVEAVVPITPPLATRLKSSERSIGLYHGQSAWSTITIVIA